MSKQLLSKVDQSWCLFLDRDGVINKRNVNGYITSISEFEFLPGVLQSLGKMHNSFAHTFVVTNQQCIAKNELTHEKLHGIHNYMLFEINNAGGYIDQIYYSPDLAHIGSQTRKPAIGMALQAEADFPWVNLKKSIMVGDSPSDMQFGKNAGMLNVFVNENGGRDPLAEICVRSLLEFSLLLELS